MGGNKIVIVLFGNRVSKCLATIQLRTSMKTTPCICFVGRDTKLKLTVHEQDFSNNFGFV